MESWIFLGIVAVMIAVFDVVVIARKGKPASISANMIRAFRKFPALNGIFWMGVGIIFGHVTWSMRTEDIYENVKCIDITTGKEISR